jgi:hypothetical protein
MSDQIEVVKGCESRPPTRRQKVIAELCVLHPEWTAARVLRTAGAAASTALHQAGREINRPGTQRALAEAEREFRNTLGKRITLDDAAEGLANLAKNATSETARLSAIERCLSHLGVVDPADQRRVMILVQQQVVDVIAPIVLDAIPSEAVPAVRAALQAALREREAQRGGNQNEEMTA